MTIAVQALNHCSENSIGMPLETQMSVKIKSLLVYAVCNRSVTADCGLEQLLAKSCSSKRERT